MLDPFDFNRLRQRSRRDMRDRAERTVVDLCDFEVAPGVKAQANARSVGTPSITAGSNVLTGTNIAGSQVGETVSFIGAGTAGGVLVSTVTAVGSGQVELADNAGTTVSSGGFLQGGRCVIGWDVGPALLEAIAAVAATANNGGYLQLPKGTLLFSGEVEVPSGVGLVGVGPRGTDLRPADSGTRIYVTGRGPSIKGFWFQGRGLAQNALVVDSTDRYYEGIETWATTDDQIILGSALGTAQNNTFVGVKANNSATSCWVIDGESGGNQFINCYAQRWATAAIHQRQTSGDIAPHENFWYGGLCERSGNLAPLPLVDEDDALRTILVEAGDLRFVGAQLGAEGPNARCCLEIDGGTVYATSVTAHGTSGASGSVFAKLRGGTLFMGGACEVRNFWRRFDTDASSRVHPGLTTRTSSVGAFVAGSDESVVYDQADYLLAVPALTVDGIPATVETLGAGGDAPAGAIAVTTRRSSRHDSVAAALTSGTLLVARTLNPVPAGQTVTGVVFISGSQAAVTPTNQWACIIDPVTLAVLAVSADDTTNTWTNDSSKTFTLTAPWTPGEDIYPYIGICVVAGTVPALMCTASNRNGLNKIDPKLVAPSSAGLTDPASLGSTAGAFGISPNGVPFAYLV